jgi:hypothetical protein
MSIVRTGALLFLVAFALPTAAVAEAPIYRCIGDGIVQDLRIEAGEWYARTPGEGDWTAKGCGQPRTEGGSTIAITCSADGDRLVARQVQTYSDGSSMVRQETLDMRARSYTNAWAQQIADGSGDRVSCEILTDPNAPVGQGWNLSRKIAAGLPFVFITEREALRLRPGDWTYPRGRWVMIEGRYHPFGGTWDVNGVGFDPGRTNPYHSCPAATGCGGVHQQGFTLDRPYRPEDHEFVAFGQTFTFDEAGSVFFEGVRVGLLVVPAL